MNTNRMIRQGDVLLVPIDRIPAGARSIAREGARLILAEGEATGHAHAVLDPGAELLESDLEERFLRVLEEGGVTVSHEEHAPVLVPPGDYEVRRQREYKPQAPPQRVWD